MEKKLKVGDKVWQYDVNRRTYARDEHGKAYGGPIYRESWYAYQIVDETSKSFVLSNGNKLPKRGTYVTSEEELDQQVFVHENGYKIAEKVRYCHDYKTLKEVERLVNQHD